jgi:hypothetical protein
MELPLMRGSSILINLKILRKNEKKIQNRQGERIKNSQGTGAEDSV